VEEGAHDLRVVVDVTQEDRLTSQGDAGTCQTCTGGGRLPGDLFGVAEMDAHPQGVKAFEQGGKFRGDPLRHDYRHLGAYAEYLHMGNAPETGKEVFELGVGQGQGISAADQYIPDSGVGCNIVDGLFPLEARGMGEPAHTVRAGTVPAIGRADLGHQKKHPVGVTVDEPRNGRGTLLVQGVAFFFGPGGEFLQGGHHHPAQGMAGPPSRHQ